MNHDICAIGSGTGDVIPSHKALIPGITAKYCVLGHAFAATPDVTEIGHSRPRALSALLESRGQKLSYFARDQASISPRGKCAGPCVELDTGPSSAEGGQGYGQCGDHPR